jgi:hypothetical protein
MIAAAVVGLGGPETETSRGDIARMNDEYVYCDFVGFGFAKGKQSEVTITNTAINKVVTQFKTAHRSLTKLGMKTEVGGTYGAVTGSVAVSADNETELTKSLEQEITKETQSVIKNKFILGEDEDYGTVIWQVDFQIGGRSVTVPISQRTALWTSRDVQQFKGKSLTHAMKSMVIATGNTFENVPHKSCVIPPVTGKTCHHVKFLRAFDDSCEPDAAKHCLIMDGSHFAVCHHHDRKWIGGPECNCDHVDGTNVVLVTARSLSNLYA